MGIAVFERIGIEIVRTRHLHSIAPGAATRGCHLRVDYNVDSDARIVGWERLQRQCGGVASVGAATGVGHQLETHLPVRVRRPVKTYHRRSRFTAYISFIAPVNAVILKMCNKNADLQGRELDADPAGPVRLPGRVHCRRQPQRPAVVHATVARVPHRRNH
jgi:hypothetical protein